MPLQEIAASVAFKNLRTRSSIWPQRGRLNRKGLLPLPEIQPSFHFSPQDKFFCMGSCFAQHVGSVLQTEGFNVVTNEPSPFGPDQWGGSNHLIRYNIHAIANEFKWALGVGRPHTSEMYAPEGGSNVMDPFGHTQWQPHSVHALDRIRAFTAKVTSRLAECRVIIITLGLVEVWFDKKLELYTNIQPSVAGIKNEPDRYVLRVLSHDDVVQSLENIHTILSEHGHPDFKILLTTSPVPLHATMRGMDVFSANCYSKSVQRGAVDEFVLRHTNVDYFPSYEAITLGNPDVIWKDDQRHVNDLAVSAVMEHVLMNYVKYRTTGSAHIEAVAKLEAQLARYGATSTMQNMLGLIAENNALRGSIHDLKQSITKNSQALIPSAEPVSSQGCSGESSALVQSL